MIEQELLLLGLLKERPRHGYEIKTKIIELLKYFAGIDIKSIYYPLRVMEKKGLLTKHTDKHGKRPARIIYSLTPKGQRRFDELLDKSFFHFKRPQFSSDVSLYFLNYARPDTAKRKLRARLFILRKISKELSNVLKSQELRKLPGNLSLILRHNLEMLEAESQFLSSLMSAVKT
ncbi:MAG: PadR family transcriptional regulator [Candidatus Omnitrophota bacterium]|jgi:DNA-binding PadR family transcriptional regulator|nr:MAG: PadR family transcriptional regulator [Candidatus Omnitrophota bacterium]